MDWRMFLQPYQKFISTLEDASTKIVKFHLELVEMCIVKLTEGSCGQCALLDLKDFANSRILFPLEEIIFLCRGILGTDKP